MSNQAEKIRKLVKEYLSTEDYLNTISNDPIVKGIRYKNLKQMLRKESDNFSEGGITGALYSLIKNNSNIKKIKTDNGTFYFDGSKYSFNLSDNNTNNKTKVNILNNINDDIENIIDKVKLLLSKDYSMNLTKIDKDFVIKLLDYSTKMKQSNDNYQNEKIKENLYGNK